MRREAREGEGNGKEENEAHPLPAPPPPPPPDMKSWIKPWAVVITPPLQLMMTPSVYDKFSSTWTYNIPVEFKSQEIHINTVWIRLQYLYCCLLIQLCTKSNQFIMELMCLSLPLKGDLNRYLFCQYLSKKLDSQYVQTLVQFICLPHSVMNDLLMTTVWLSDSGLIW